MAAPLYEHPAWQSAPQQVMRPGGLEITARALTLCCLPPGARLLDLGCGMGATLRHISAGFEVRGLGVDISTRLLRQARQINPAAGFAQASGERLPFAGESLDAILAECTLSIMQTEDTLRECARVLKTGGYLIANDVYARNEAGIGALRSLPAGTCIGAAMAERQILELLSGCGLQVTHWMDCSEKLREFSVCTLATAAEVDPFDLYIAAGRAKLGYYFAVAQKCSATME